MNQTPNLFHYDDYRSFLKDIYHYKKGQHATFSFRVFARMAGFKSSSVLKLVMDGKRNLTRESAGKFCRALKFSQDQTRYFRTLTDFNQSEDMDDRQSLAMELMKVRISKNITPSVKSQFDYWSKWYHVAIREMVGLKGFQEDAAWIAKSLRPTITPREAEKAIKTLLSLGLLNRDAAGKLIQAEGDIASDDRIVHACIASFHQAMIQKGRDAIQRFERTQRHISSVTVGMTEANKNKAKELIQNLHKELLALSAKATDPDARVVQINFQLFPLTDVIA